MLDLSDNKEGTIIKVLRGVQAGQYRHVVIDVGAREEHKMTNALPWLLNLVRQLGGRLIVVRPITLGSHNQLNARAFMDVADQLDIPVVFAQNEGQGRDPRFFRDWRNSKTCADAAALGAVHTEIVDFGVRHSDEAIGFGLSLADCAVQDFSKIEDDEERAIARKYFDDDICSMLNERLRISLRRLGDACEEAVEIRDDIIKTRGVAAGADEAVPTDDGPPGAGNPSLPASGAERCATGS